MVVISVGAVEVVAVVDGQGVEDRLPAVDPAGEVVTSGLVLVRNKSLYRSQGDSFSHHRGNDRERNGTCWAVGAHATAPS